MSKYEQNSMSDEWYTPQYIFDALGVRFYMDVAAPKDRQFTCVPAHEFITENSLETEWKGFIWCNPPFGGRNGIVPWLDKFFLHKNGISLAPDRTSAPWWQNAAQKADWIFLIRNKVKFLKQDGSKGLSPSTGTTLFGMGDIAFYAFEQASKKGLGTILMKP